MRVVLCAEGPLEPRAGLEHYLTGYPATPTDPVHLVFGMRRTPPPQLPGFGHGLTVGTFLPGRGLRGYDGIEYHRRSYSEICASLLDGSFTPTVVIACATPTGAEDSRTLGAVNGYLELALDRAEQIVIEQVDWLPSVPGAARVPRADVVVPSDHTRSESQPGFSTTPTAVDLAIARNVASLVPRDATIALGIGRVNDAVAAELLDRGDLRVLTGVITDSMRLLHERSGVSGAPMQSMSVVGSPALLEWSHTSGAVRLRPSTQVHDPDWLAEHDRFVCVLGAAEIDLQGNVNSERAGSTLVSGRGGAPDFALGAHRSSGGRSIVALSATHSGPRSRLVEHLADPTIPGDWIDAVATERGIADLAGRSADQRREALIKIF